MTNIGNNKETHDIMENSVYTPSEVLERIMQAGEKRILLPVVRCILLGMLAGGFIAFGAAASQRCEVMSLGIGVSASSGALFAYGVCMFNFVRKIRNS